MLLSFVDFVQQEQNTGRWPCLRGEVWW